jgi:hypothetical protein
MQLTPPAIDREWAAPVTVETRKMGLLTRINVSAEASVAGGLYNLH